MSNCEICFGELEDGEDGEDFGLNRICRDCHENNFGENAE